MINGVPVNGFFASAMMSFDASAPISAFVINVISSCSVVLSESVRALKSLNKRQATMLSFLYGGTPFVLSNIPVSRRPDRKSVV